MTWQALETTPIFAGCTVPPARAAAVRAALQRRIVPVLVARQSRLEPLATGALCTDAGRTYLLTCRHALDEGAPLGDLAVPLPGSRMLWLRDARPRVFVHPRRDLAMIELRGGAARSLAQHYCAVPLANDDLDQADALPAGDARTARVAVLAGFPYAQMRRFDGVLYARPLIAFVSLRADLSATSSSGFVPALPRPGADVFLSYPRLAVRADGAEIHAPELDGVSGATLWTVHDESADGIGCVLRASGIQVAFKPGAYARAEPMTALRDLLDHVRA